MSSHRPRNRLDVSARDWTISTSVALVYATVLFYSYRLFVSPVYAYQGLTFRDPDLVNYGIALVLVALLAGILPARVRRASDFLQWLLFMIASAPTILLPHYMNEISVSEALRLSVVIAACTVIIRVGTAFYHPRRQLVRVQNPDVIWLVLGIYAAVIYSVMIATVGISLQWISLLDVYSVRSEFALAASPVPLLGYALPVLYNVVNPAFMARGVYSVRKGWFMAGAGGQVLIYMTTGSKSVLFSIVAIVAISWLFRRELRPRGVHILAAVSLAAVGAVAVDWLLRSDLWTALITRRYLVVPGALTVSYVAVFQDRPRGNFGKYLPGVDYPYEFRAPSHIVGESLSGNPLTNANVNPWGDGYFQYGYLGMIVASLLLVGVFCATDAACRNLPTPVAALVMFMPGDAIASASTFTTLLSHGYVAALVVCALLPRTGWARRPVARDRSRHAAVP